MLLCGGERGNAEQAEGLVFEQQNSAQGPGRMDLERREEMESQFGEWTKENQHKCVHGHWRVRG